jgi:hypothetical protein
MPDVPESDVQRPQVDSFGGAAVVRQTVTVPISGPAPATGAAFVQFTAFTPATWTSNDIAVDPFAELAIDFDVTTLTAGTAQLLIDRKDGAGLYRNLATAVAKTAAATDIVTLGVGVPLSAALGAATGATAWSAPYAFGDILRIRVIVATGNLTGTLSIKGK